MSLDAEDFSIVLKPTSYSFPHTSKVFRNDHEIYNVSFIKNYNSFNINLTEHKLVASFMYENDSYYLKSPAEMVLAKFTKPRRFTASYIVVKNDLKFIIHPHDQHQILNELNISLEYKSSGFFARTHMIARGSIADLLRVDPLVLVASMYIMYADRLWITAG